MNIIMRIIGTVIGILFLLCFIPLFLLFMLSFIFAWACGIKFKITVDKREVGYLRWFKVSWY